MKREEVDINKVTPMMKQYLEIKEENKDCIIFFRLGDFYEMFFEDAVCVSQELELTLTGKSCGLDKRIPMCGVPHHSSNIYIEKLVEKGYRIAIVEQLEDAASVKGIVKRGVAQIISIGTIINENSLNETDNNFIGGLYENILVMLDISTGEIKLKNIVLDNLLNEVMSCGIKELITNKEIEKNLKVKLKNIGNVNTIMFNLIENIYKYNNLTDELLNSVNHLLTYITKVNLRDLSHLKEVEIIEEKNYLLMDIHTKRNLELTKTLRHTDRTYSLLWLLDKTKTAMGSRKLKTWIENPLINKIEIEKRYDIIDNLMNNFMSCSELVDLLESVYDLERLSGRIAFMTANARDMLQLKKSISVLPAINSLLKEFNFYKELIPLDSLYQLIEESIYENPPIGIKEGYLIKEGYNKELDELKDLRKGGKDFIAKFEISEREKTGIKNLKVGYNKVFGYFIEISKGNCSLVKEEYGYERKQTLSNCERFISPILKEKEALILNAEDKIIELEYNLFIDIRNKVKEYINILQHNASVISEIDVLQSFTNVSETNNYVRPTLNNNNAIKIIENRHPVVEKVIDSPFISNDIIMDINTNMLLITGPNMAGKSTFMRQMAITTIMAQIGCFVPAKEANTMIFDAIYTRIGASDDLVSGESTFMVEMLEANRAVSNATNKSLILFDELGRGTATYDGMALAQSIIEYINKKIKAKTMFSTHYHELTSLELNGLKNVHVSAFEEDGKITFLHKIKDGSIDKSYGVHVASLAGLNDEIIKRADQILQKLENKEIKENIEEYQNTPKFEQTYMELDNNKLTEFIKEIDLMNTTPIEAINILNKIKHML